VACPSTSSTVQLITTRTFTAHLSVLQHLKELELDEACLEAVAADGNVLKVADLLPSLQQCTKLTIHARGAPELTAAAAAFHAMPALQDLYFDSYDEEAGPPISLVALPTTLTRLCLYSETVVNGICAESICQLTGLRVLEVEALGFNTSEENGGSFNNVMM